MERISTIILALVCVGACAGEDSETAGDSTTSTTTGEPSTSGDGTTSTSTTSTSTGESSTTGAPVGCEAAAAACFIELTEEACNHCRVECNEQAAENPCSTWKTCSEMQGGGCGCAHFWCSEGLNQSADEESRVGICKACVELCADAPSRLAMCEEHL